MRILLKALVALVVLIGLISVVVGIAWILTAPESLPKDSISAARLVPGPHPVGKSEFQWVDVSRPTAANGDFPGSAERSFQVTVWYPRGARGKQPLLVYCHGFTSSRYGTTYLMEDMASHGYVVVAADFPLTHLGAPGGPFANDVVNQPADVSFLIDQALALHRAERPFEGEIDRERIGVFGLSLGGIAATLVAFHPEWRDPRVKAAVALAGAGDVFGPRFFDNAAVPFLMISGTADAIVDYETNALPIPNRILDGGLVSLEGGTHVGFAQVAGGLMRILGNPDKVACRFLAGDIETTPSNPFSGLFGPPEQGLIEVAEYPPPCANTFEQAMPAGRQQMLTRLAVRAFFDSHFALAPEVRADHAEFLASTLPAELPELTFTPGRR